MHNYLFLIAGVFTFLMALFSLWKEVTMRRGGVRTTGVVVGVEQENDGEGRLYRPLVQFVTNDGQQILWKSTSAASFWKNARGKSMRIIYDPRNPQRVISNHWTGYAFVVLLCLMCAVCMAIFFGIVPITQAQNDTIFYISLLPQYNKPN